MSINHKDLIYSLFVSCIICVIVRFFRLTLSISGNSGWDNLAFISLSIPIIILSLILIFTIFLSDKSWTRLKLTVGMTASFILLGIIARTMDLVSMNQQEFYRMTYRAMAAQEYIDSHFDTYKDIYQKGVEAVDSWVSDSLTVASSLVYNDYMVDSLMVFNTYDDYMEGSILSSGPTRFIAIDFYGLKYEHKWYFRMTNAPYSGNKQLCGYNIEESMPWLEKIIYLHSQFYHDHQLECSLHPLEAVSYNSSQIEYDSTYATYTFRKKNKSHLTTLIKRQTSQEIRRKLKIRNDIIRNSYPLNMNKSGRRQALKTNRNVIDAIMDYNQTK